MKKIFWKNTVTVRVNNFERFANECKRNGILLENVRVTETGYECDMSFHDFRMLREVGHKAGARIHILRKRGAGYFVRRHKKRYGFYVGAILALMLFVYLTSCIWVIDVVGNDITSKQKILEVMKDNGIAIGELRFGKKISQIKNNSLIELDTLSWLWVTIDGTRALVEVREKGESKEIIDKKTPCNLVASYPAEVVDMQVKSGRKVVERGKIVEKGELLVSGVTETAYRANRYIHSMGSVMGRTWRTEDGIYRYTDEKRIPTGKKSVRYTLSFPKGKISIGGKKAKDFKNYDKIMEEKQLKIFENIYLPLTFTRETFCEIIVEYEKLTEDVVLKRAVDYLTRKAEENRSDGAHTVKRTYAYEKRPDGNLYVELTLESIENIALPVRIDVYCTEEDSIG